MKEWLKAESIADTEKFYEEKYKENGLDAFKKTDWSFFFFYLKMFFDTLRPTDSILDCGSGGGHFLKSIVNRYPDNHPYLCGIELSRTAATLADEHLKGKALIACGDYMSIDSFPVNSFDIVTCFGTIEHAPDIEKAFDRIFDYAKPGGVVMITFPLDFEGCMEAIKKEPNQKNNERFATAKEWEEIVYPWIRPFATTVIENDLLMVFRKWVHP